MTLKSIETAKTKIDEVNILKKQQLSEIDAKLADLNTKIGAYEKAKEEASEKMDAEAYLKAENALSTLAVQKKMYTDRLHLINDKPMISADEYKALTDSIMKEYAAEEDSAEKQLYSLSKKMKNISDALGAEYTEANKVLNTLQADLYKYQDCKQRNGFIITGRKEIKGNDGILWGNSVFDFSMCAEYRSKHEQ